MRASADFSSVALRQNLYEQKVDYLLSRAPGEGPGEGDLAAQIARLNTDVGRLFRMTVVGSELGTSASDPRRSARKDFGPSATSAECARSSR